MKSICFYSSYFIQRKIPEYIKYYLSELKNNFSEVIFLFNEHEVDPNELIWLNQNSIGHRNYVNEGFDFGMWHKAFQEFDIPKYDRVGLVNDSCILFKPLNNVFNYIDGSGMDVCGMTDSNAVSYHLQSYFLVINSKAISFVSEYFRKHGILKNINDVISVYEIGLSRELVANGYLIGAMFSKKDYAGEFNPMLLFGEEFIRNGIPLIKKKIMQSSFRSDELFTVIRMQINTDPDYYKGLIVAHNSGLSQLRIDLLECKQNKLKVELLKIASFIFTMVRGRRKL